MVPTAPGHGAAGGILRWVLVIPTLGTTGVSLGGPGSAKGSPGPATPSNYLPILPPALFPPFPNAAPRLLMNFDSYNKQVIISKRMESNYLLCWGIR